MNDRELLSDLTPGEQAELGDLTELEAALLAYNAPDINSAHLMGELTPLLHRTVKRPHIHDWRGLLRTQTTLPGTGFWWASGLLFALGLLLVLASDGTGGLLFALASPLVAGFGVTYLLRPATRGLRELERLSAIRPLELLYVRLLLVLTYNTGLALPLILIGWGQGTDVVLWRVLMVWFGPMVGMTGAAFYITLRWNPLAGIGVPLGAWAALVFLGWQDVVASATVFNLTADLMLLIVVQSDVILAGSLLALLIGLLMLVMTGQQVRRLETL